MSSSHSAVNEADKLKAVVDPQDLQLDHLTD